ncbi:MAG: DUF6602 domain-containing protein [Dehalococcoidia bacterium]
MVSKLTADRKALIHPGSSGSAAEINWQGMLSDYLPSRYRVSSGQVVDVEGSVSDHIDVIIFDRQYSPLLFNQDGAIYVPAESVYGVFEVRQTLKKNNIEYAGGKAASVRKLKRTTARIPHAGGFHEPKSPFRIFGGILTLNSSWQTPLVASLKKALEFLSQESQLDLGCALRQGAFEVHYAEKRLSSVEVSPPDATLVFFLLKLFSSLQRLGTVPAIDFHQYGKIL